MVAGLTRRIGFAAQAPSIPLYGYTIVKTYPHDPRAFTQGLQYVNGVLYEGTGLNGRSSIRKVKLETGEVQKSYDIDRQYFGEGIAVLGSQLFELTWKSELGFVYDLTTLQPKRSFKYKGEGWGLTHDGTNLIMSDGSEELRFIDPATLTERRRVKVTANGEPVKWLNELEYVKGEVFANVWQTDYVVRIDPASGKVTGYVDLRNLLTPPERAQTDVLNGIAYDAARDRLFVTGKLWPKLFEIRLVRKS